MADDADVVALLQHRNRFRILDAPTVIQFVFTVGDGLDPIRKSAHELAIIMRVARGKIKRAVRADCADGTRRHAQLAFQARVVIEFPRIRADLRADENRAEQNEIAEARMNHVAMYAHAAPGQPPRRRKYPVGSKISCGFAIVEFQQASQPLAGLDLAGRFTDSILRPRKENHIPFPLVVPFPMKMKDVIG